MYFDRYFTSVTLLDELKNKGIAGTGTTKSNRFLNVGFPTAYINQHLAILRAPAINPVYLAAALSSPPAMAQWNRVDRDAVKSGLNFDDIREFRVLVPSRGLQEKYAQLAREKRRLTAQVRESLRQAEHLFQTLLHEAFGEVV